LSLARALSLAATKKDAWNALLGFFETVFFQHDRLKMSTISIANLENGASNGHMSGLVLETTASASKKPSSKNAKY